MHQSQRCLRKGTCGVAFAGCCLPEFKLGLSEFKNHIHLERQLREPEGQMTEQRQRPEGMQQVAAGDDDAERRGRPVSVRAASHLW